MLLTERDILPVAKRYTLRRDMPLTGRDMSLLGRDMLLTERDMSLTGRDMP